MTYLRFGKGGNFVFCLEYDFVTFFTYILYSNTGKKGKIKQNKSVLTK